MQHGKRRAQAEDSHAVAALVFNLVALPVQRQAVDLDHVVQHAGEDAYHLAVLLVVEACLLGEGELHEAGQVDGAEQAGSVGR